MFEFYASDQVVLGKVVEQENEFFSVSQFCSVNNSDPFRHVHWIGVTIIILNYLYQKSGPFCYYLCVNGIF